MYTKSLNHMLMAVMATLVLVAACSKKDEAPKTASGEMIVKIGQVSPLTGPQAHLGKDNDNGARLAIDDVVQPALRAALVVHGLEGAQRIGDAPARVGIDPDVLLVLGRDLVRVAAPLEPAFLEGVHRLDERDLHVQPRFGVGRAELPATLASD